MFVIQCDTYEDSIGKRRPVVTHTFYGDTGEQVQRVLKAHMESDAFFRACMNSNHYNKIGCWTEVKMYEK